MKKVLLLIICTLILIPAIVYAHPGQTDSDGGHYDRSTGKYHYHHGYSSHQHTNNECPYDFDDKTGESSNGLSGNLGNNVYLYSEDNPNEWFFWGFIPLVTLLIFFGYKGFSALHKKHTSITQPPKTFETYHFEVAGTSYKTDVIESLSTENPEYEEIYELSAEERDQKYRAGDFIYKYLFRINTVTLVPEPTNPYDKNAIMVLINDSHVGYIKRVDCLSVKELMASNNIFIEAKIYGGPYKFAITQYSTEHIVFRNSSSNYSITVTLTK